MSSTDISDIILRDFEQISDKETLSSALSKFRENRLAMLAVYKGKEYSGIVTERIIVRSMRNLDTRLRKLVRHVPKLTGEASIYDAAGLMFQNDVKHLPVFDDNRENLIGFVTDEGILGSAINAHPDFASLGVEGIMSENVCTVNEKDTMASVLNLFRDKGVSRAPVMSSKGDLVGIVTMHDCVNLLVPRKKQKSTDYSSDKIPLLNVPVRDFMTDNVITISPDAVVKDVVNLVTGRKISGPLVVDGGRVLGIITKSDLLESMTSIESSEEVRFAVQFSTEMDYDADHIRSDLRALVDKFERFLKNGMIHISFKQHKENRNGTHLVLCRIRLRSARGFYMATGEGWGVESAFHIALDHIERQILKAKEIGNDPASAKRFLDKISL